MSLNAASIFIKYFIVYILYLVQIFWLTSNKQNKIFGFYINNLCYLELVTCLILKYDRKDEGTVEFFLDFCNNCCPPTNQWFLLHLINSDGDLCDNCMQRYNLRAFKAKTQDVRLDTQQHSGTKCPSNTNRKVLCSTAASHIFRYFCCCNP